MSEDASAIRLDATSVCGCKLPPPSRRLMELMAANLIFERGQAGVELEPERAAQICYMTIALHAGAVGHEAGKSP